jgi:hypothetical protein
MLFSGFDTVYRFQSEDGDEYRGGRTVAFRKLTGRVRTEAKMEKRAFRSVRVSDEETEVKQ